LKPSNLFLADAAGTETLKVLDFGISKEGGNGQPLTSTGHMLGTAHYMSPEQIKESKTADARTDIWALGVIMHELLTSAFPFGDHADAQGEVFGLVLHTEPKKIRDTLPTLPEELEQIILRCLEREPDDRFRDVGSLAEALRPFALPASAPKIEAVRKALLATPPNVRREASDPKLEAALAPTKGMPAATASPAPAAEAPTKAPTPDRAPTLAGQSTSFRSAKAVSQQAPSRRGVGLGVGLLASAVVALLVGMRIGARGSPTGPATEAHAAALSAPAPTPSPAPVTSEPAPVASVSASPSVSSVLALPLPPSTVRPSPSPPVHRPPPHPTVAASAPPRASSPQGSLLDGLDRK
jgi:serine/threonine-protein kinase